MPRRATDPADGLEWTHRRADNSYYANDEWFMAQVWPDRGGEGWYARIDTMNARFVPGADNSRRVQADDGFGRRVHFATADEAKAYVGRKFGTRQNPRGKRIVWRRLADDAGALNPAIKSEADKASGAYAIRDRKTHRVEYVGESHTGRMWKTLLRHFQAPESFRRVRERGVFTGDAKRYEIALWVESRGARPRGKSSPDENAMAAQAAWIARLKPAKNTDDGKAAPDYPPDWDDLDEVANPRAKWTALGRVTRIDFENGRHVAWSYASAPMLIYAPGIRAPLRLVYAPVRARAASREEVAEYKKTHWGEPGAGEVSEGEIAAGPFAPLGRSTSITYTTRKGAEGGGELVDYVHTWGEGGRGPVVPPMLAVHRCGGRCAHGGRLALLGGSYRVTSRGIVG